MPNFGGKVVAVRLMLLKQYLEANTGKNRLVTRGEIKEFLEEKSHKVKRRPSTLTVCFWMNCSSSIWNRTNTRKTGIC